MTLIQFINLTKSKKGTMFFLMFACGAIWPLESVPTHFKWFAYSTPLGKNELIII